MAIVLEKFKTYGKQKAASDAHEVETDDVEEGAGTAAKIEEDK
jgi:hypothetical protein